MHIIQLLKIMLMDFPPLLLIYLNSIPHFHQQPRLGFLSVPKHSAPGNSKLFGQSPR